MDIHTVHANQVLDLTENICQLIEGYPRDVAFFSLINSMAVISLDKSEVYHEDSKVMISRMASEVFSEKGLNATICLKQIIIHRWLNSQQKGYKTNKH